MALYTVQQLHNTMANQALLLLKIATQLITGSLFSANATIP
jgi:hypothetical protein